MSLRLILECQAHNVRVLIGQPAVVHAEITQSYREEQKKKKKTASRVLGPAYRAMDAGNHLPV